MPKFDPKQIQKEIEQGRLWPLYWIFGNEKFKSRELFNLIRKTVLGAGGVNAFGWGEQVLEGAETSGEEIVDLALSPTLGGGSEAPGDS